MASNTVSAGLLLVSATLSVTEHYATTTERATQPALSCPRPGNSPECPVRQVEKGDAVVFRQALSYMLGRIEIESLRAEAQARLGAAFDIRSFHQTVLGNGAVPLSTLRSVVREWVDSG